MDFKSLKAASASSISSLSDELKKASSTSENTRKNDDRFWTPTVDKAGNGYAIIRFLPAPAGEDVPFVRMFDHGFQGPGGKWYIENSLTTIGKQDPVSEYNSKLWNSTTDDNSPARKQARAQKRRLHYISNIQVIQDQANPANEGKVFLYKYGKKIFDKINEALSPEFADETPMNPFDLWAGAPFKLKIRNVEGYRNYDKSEFGEVGPLSDDDKVLEKIWKSEYSLQAFLAPDNFKSFDDLKEKLLTVLAEPGADFATKAKKAETMEAYADDAPAFKSKAGPAIAASAEDDTDDEAMEFFKSLAAGS